jgi:hypothetical protein
VPPVKSETLTRFKAALGAPTLDIGFNSRSHAGKVTDCAQGTSAIDKLKKMKRRNTLIYSI